MTISVIWCESVPGTMLELQGPRSLSISDWTELGYYYAICIS